MLYQKGFITTAQSLRILAKCHETVLQNQIFLVLEGPTGLGKTHVPGIYALLTHGEQQNGKLVVPENKRANISFHRGKDESDLQGNLVVKGEKI